MKQVLLQTSWWCQKEQTAIFPCAIRLWIIFCKRLGAAKTAVCVSYQCRLDMQYKSGLRRRLIINGGGAGRAGEAASVGGGWGFVGAWLYVSGLQPWMVRGPKPRPASLT